MEYQEFVETIKAEIKNSLGKTTQVCVNRVLKNNLSFADSLSILQEGENAAPAIYLRPLFSKYCRGERIDVLVEQILAFHRSFHSCRKVEFNFYREFELIRHQLMCKLVNHSKNSQLLECVPHDPFLDLEVVYYCNVDDPMLGKGSILVQDSHLEMWGITRKQLREIAQENTKNTLSYEIISISDMFLDMLGVHLEEDADEQYPMYALTNKECNFGAVTMIFPHVLDAVAQVMQEDFYVLPSSIHECMIIPVRDGGAISPAELRVMVKEINEVHVAPEEVLGDSVYRYFVKEKKLRIVAGGEDMETGGTE